VTRPTAIRIRGTSGKRRSEGTQTTKGQDGAEKDHDRTQNNANKPK
jgi:hypothetical protein